MDTQVELIILDILRRDLTIPEANIWIRNQNKRIPNDTETYYVIGTNDVEVMSVRNNTSENQAGDLDETLTVASRANVQIDIAARSTDPLTRRWEVMAALRSVYAQQQQEEHDFRIFRIPTAFVNTSAVEGGEELMRFSITIPCHVWYRKTQTIQSDPGDYYDTFPARVDDEETIGTDTGLIEFEIQETT